MAPPVEITEWIQRTYPRPTIDPEWLSACLDYLTSSLNIPQRPLPPLIAALDAQLLASDLQDSTLPTTGLPSNIARLNEVDLQGPPVLVEIIAITEIGSSAFQLMQVQAAREESGIVGGVVGLDGEEDELDGGRVQKYPRGMLRLQLSDGCRIVEAIEYRSIPQLELGVTPLGYKLLLKNPRIRRGIIFLEPARIELKGGSSEDREVNQERDFLKGLRVRLGRPEPEENEENAPPQPPAAAEVPIPAPIPIPDSPPPTPPPPRAPFREISPPPSDPHEDDIDAPLRRKLPAPAPPQPPSTGSTLVPSSYFTEGSTAVAGPSSNASILAQERIFSSSAGPSRSTGVILVPSSPSPSPPPPPSTQRPIAHLPRRGGGGVKKEPHNKTTSANSSSDFDFGEEMVMDEEALQALDLLEVQASAPLPIPRAVAGDDEVIVIDDDDEEGDKENVPVPTRNVRRRVQVQEDDDFIEISD